jgi:putative SOS response-associated peptidase YedK
MCGRYSITTPVEGLRKLFDFREQPNLKPNYNVAPTQDVPVIRLEDDGKTHLRLLHWGLIPFWAKEKSIGNRMINARSETVAEKPSFRNAFKKRRCLVVADGFYEWKKAANGKQPYRIVMKDREPFAFAGLWESWRDKEDDREVESCTFISTDSNETMRQIHPRMPVILGAKDHGLWLDPEAPGGADLLKPCPDAWLEAYPVSTHVNKPSNNDPTCIEPLEGTEQQ